MTLGFVLINVENGKEDILKKKISKIRGVKEVHILYGDFDIIATLEASDPTTLATIVVDKIRALEGVKSTRTHVVIKE